MFEEGEEGGESVGRYLTPFLYISIAVALLISLFSEEIISILTPESYHDSIDIVIVLSMLYGSYFSASNRSLFLQKDSHHFHSHDNEHRAEHYHKHSIHNEVGSNGSSMGTLLAGLTSGTVSFIVSQRYYKIRWEYRKIAPIFMIFFGSAVTMILLRNLGISYEMRVVVKLVSLVGYLYLGVKLNFISKQNYLLTKKMVLC